eukprot:gene14542-22252_t
MAYTVNVALELYGTKENLSFSFSTDLPELPVFKNLVQQSYRLEANRQAGQRNAQDVVVDDIELYDPVNCCWVRIDDTRDIPNGAQLYVFQPTSTDDQGRIPAARPAPVVVPNQGPPVPADKSSSLAPLSPQKYKQRTPDTRTTIQQPHVNDTYTHRQPNYPHQQGTVSPTLQQHFRGSDNTVSIANLHADLSSIPMSADVNSRVSTPPVNCIMPQDRQSTTCHAQGTGWPQGNVVAHRNGSIITVDVPPGMQQSPCGAPSAHVHQPVSMDGDARAQKYMAHEFGQTRHAGGRENQISEHNPHPAQDQCQQRFRYPQQQSAYSGDPGCNNSRDHAAAVKPQVDRTVACGLQPQAMGEQPRRFQTCDVDCVRSASGGAESVGRSSNGRDKLIYGGAHGQPATTVVNPNSNSSFGSSIAGVPGSQPQRHSSVPYPQKPKRVVLVMGVGRDTLGDIAVRWLAAHSLDPGVQYKYVVIATGRNEHVLKELKTEMQHVHFYALDVTDFEAVANFAAKIDQVHGPPHLILNAVGLSLPPEAFDRIPPAQFDLQIDTIVKGTANVCRSFLDSMLNPRSVPYEGVIVNFTSNWGRTAVDGHSALCAGKWAVEGLSKSIAQELPPFLACVPVNPGAVNTSGLRTLLGPEQASEAMHPAAVFEIAKYNQGD